MKTKISGNIVEIMTEMSLETALKLIPIYGDDRNLDLQSYIDGVGFVLSNVTIAEQSNYLKIAKLRLRGEVGAAVRRNDLNTWNELKEFLRSRTDKQQSKSFLEAQLISMKQKHGETIQHFADSIEKIGHKLIIALCKVGIDSKMAELSTERRMHKSFTKGVIEPFRNILLNRKTHSFNDAVKDALMLELELEEDKVLDKRKKCNQEKCYRCGKLGHRAANCRHNKEIKVVGNHNNNNRIKQIICYNCGKPGHLARNCRSTQQQKVTYNNQRHATQGYESKPSGNDARLPSTSRNGGSDVMKSGDYKLATSHT